MILKLKVIFQKVVPVWINIPLKQNEVYRKQTQCLEQVEWILIKVNWELVDYLIECNQDKEQILLIYNLIFEKQKKRV